MPLSDRTTGRHVDVCASGETESRAMRLAVSRAYRRIGHLFARILLDQGARVHRVHAVRRVRRCTECDGARGTQSAMVHVLRKLRRRSGCNIAETAFAAPGSHGIRAKQRKPEGPSFAPE